MLQYILSLARKHTDALGFIPRATVERYVEAGQALLARENEEPCGFLIFGNGWPRLKIYQACIQYDAQRRQRGLQLVGQVIALASERGCDAVSLWCADDLPANDFWRAAGFQLLRSKPGGHRRGRQLNLWVYWLPTNLLPGFYTLRDSENGADDEIHLALGLFTRFSLSNVNSSPSRSVCPTAISNSARGILKVLYGVELSGKSTSIRASS
jgi:hypothetical protein